MRSLTVLFIISLRPLNWDSTSRRRSSTSQPVNPVRLESLVKYGGLWGEKAAILVGDPGVLQADASASSKRSSSDRTSPAGGAGVWGSTTELALDAIRRDGERFSAPLRAAARSVTPSNLEPAIKGGRHRFSCLEAAWIPLVGGPPTGSSLILSDSNLLFRDAMPSPFADAVVAPHGTNSTRGKELEKGALGGRFMDTVPLGCPPNPSISSSRWPNAVAGLEMLPGLVRPPIARLDMEVLGRSGA